MITSSVNTAFTFPTRPSRSRSDNCFGVSLACCDVEWQAIEKIVEARQKADRSLILTSRSPFEQGIGGGVWESNPTDPLLSPRSNGFEVRAGHQTRFASAINFPIDLRSEDSNISVRPLTCQVCPHLEVKSRGLGFPGFFCFSLTRVGIAHYNTRCDHGTSSLAPLPRCMSISISE